MPAEYVGVMWVDAYDELRATRGDMVQLDLDCDAAEYEEVQNRLQIAFSSKGASILLDVNVFYPDRDQSDLHFWESRWRVREDDLGRSKALAVRKWTVICDSRRQ